MNKDVLKAIQTLPSMDEDWKSNVKKGFLTKVWYRDEDTSPKLFGKEKAMSDKLWNDTSRMLGLTMFDMKDFDKMWGKGFADKLLSDGEYLIGSEFDNPGTGKVNGCHDNAEWYSESSEGIELWTGFYNTDGLWRVHSWNAKVVQGKRQFIDITNEAHLYYGVRVK